MAQKPSIEKLRDRINRHKIGLLDDAAPGTQPEAYNLAAEIVKACIAYRYTTPFGTIFTPEYFSVGVYNAWQSVTAKAYFADNIILPPEAAVEQDSPWEDPESLAFERVAVATLGPKFIVTQQSDSALQTYRVDDAIAHTCHPLDTGKASDLTTVISRAIAPALHADRVPVTKARAVGAWQAFTTFAPVLPAPALLGQWDDDGWCLHRQKYRPDPNVSFPHIQQYLDRLNGAEQCAAMWYGIAMGVNRGRQMMYTFDRVGQGGKSKLFKTLAQELMGDTIYAAFPPSMNFADRFTMSHFVGKKLALLGDCKDAYILHRGVIKEMSGDDKTHVQRKFEQPFSTHLECRVMVSSNLPPFMVGMKHNLSRTLFLTLEPLNLTDAEIDVDYGLKCIPEIPGFLAYGEDCYRRLCPNHYAIAPSEAMQEAAELRVSVCEAEHAELFDDLFVADGDATITSKDWNKALRDAKLDRHAAHNLLEWTLAMFNTGLVLDKARRGWTMEGVRLRSHADRRSGVWEDAA